MAGDRRGFTLLEVLVSLAILSITLLLAYEVLSGAVDAELQRGGKERRDGHRDSQPAFLTRFLLRRRIRACLLRCARSGSSA